MTIKASIAFAISLLMFVITSGNETCLLAQEPTAELVPEAADRAKQLLLEEITSGRAAGASHLVMINGKSVYFQAAGKRDIQDDLPFEQDTIVRIYSMTKPITSAAAMTLFDQGKFQLGDPVSMYIPEFAAAKVLVVDGSSAEAKPAERPITVRDLLRHTSGYSYGDANPMTRKYYQQEQLRYRDPIGMYPPKVSLEKAALALSRIPADHQPGKQFTYGLNTDLLGRLIEIWSGKTLDKYMHEALFEPLKMTDTGFSVPPNKRARFASCYASKNAKLEIVDNYKTSEFNDGFEFVSGGGGLVSTVQDYANFCQMLVSEGRFQEQQILKPETVKLMFTDQLNGVAGGFQFGLGLAISDVTLGTGDDARQAKQYFWGGYASTDFRIVPEAKLVQIFFRQQVPTDNSLATRLFPIVYEGIK